MIGSLFSFICVTGAFKTQISSAQLQPGRCTGFHSIAASLILECLESKSSHTLKRGLFPCVSVVFNVHEGIQKFSTRFRSVIKRGRGFTSQDWDMILVLHGHSRRGCTGLQNFPLKTCSKRAAFLPNSTCIHIFIPISIFFLAFTGSTHI